MDSLTYVISPYFHKEKIFRVESMEAAEQRARCTIDPALAQQLDAEARVAEEKRNREMIEDQKKRGEHGKDLSIGL